MKKLGELLTEQGKLSERDVERTLLAQAEMGGLFGQVLVKLGLVSEQDLAQAKPPGALTASSACCAPGPSGSLGSLSTPRGGSGRTPYRLCSGT